MRALVPVSRWPAVLVAACSLTAPAGVLDDPDALLAAARARFASLSGYRATVHAVAADGGEELIDYAFRRPGWVRMVFEEPHAGAVLVYDPERRRVRLWPFGIGHLPSLSLSPGNPLIQGPHGHRVDRSDVGTLLAALSVLRERGDIRALGESRLAGQSALGVEVAGRVDLDGVRRFRVWLSRDALFPLRIESFAATGEPIETVDLDNVVRDAVFPARFFGDGS